MDPEPSLLFFTFAPTSQLFVGLLIFILVFCAAVVAAAEVAFFSLSAKDVALFHAFPSIEKKLSRLLSKPNKLRASLTIANKTFYLAIIILFLQELKMGFIFSENSSVVTILGIVFLIVVLLFFADVLPKVLASRNNYFFVKKLTLPVYWLDALLSPISAPMRKLTLYLHHKFTKQKTNLSVDQLSQALELTAEDATSSEEQKILEGIVSFGNTDTRQVMSPRIDIFAIEISDSFETIYPQIIEKGYSRIPVYKDNIDQIVGVLFVKDLLPYIHTLDFDWKLLLREPFFIPENKKLDDLLKDFQGMKSHLAIVVDEYGGTSGLVSLEDVIEEIVGDISDEFDDDKINYSQIDSKNFLFEGKINLKDFYRIVPVDDELFEANKGEAETLAGFILEIEGGFPKKNQ
ncbi:gliding motility-associated protein GldE [Flavobacterium sp. GNP001]